MCTLINAHMCMIDFKIPIPKLACKLFTVNMLRAVAVAPTIGRSDVSWQLALNRGQRLLATGPTNAESRYFSADCAAREWPSGSLRPAQSAKKLFRVMSCKSCVGKTDPLKHREFFVVAENLKRLLFCKFQLRADHLTSRGST